MLIDYQGVFEVRILKSSGAIACVAALLGLTALTDAQAQTVTQSGYTGIFQGISEETATIAGSSVGGGTAYAYVMKIDLDAPGVSFTTSPGAAGDTPNSGTGNEVITQTTSQFMSATGVQVAMNAGYFSCPCVTNASNAEFIDGLAVSNGNLVSSDQSNYIDLLLTAKNQASFAAGGSANLSGIYNAVAGSGYAVQNGVNVGTKINSSSTSEDPRAMIGLSQSGQYMYLVTVDSGASDGAGLNGMQLGALAVDLGLYNAINMDGGGSTSMVVQGANGKPNVLESPYTGAERYDGNSIGVYALPLAPVPLPPGLGLFASGLVGLVTVARRKLFG
jgi:hypothetical protein